MKVLLLIALIISLSFVSSLNPEEFFYNVNQTTYEMKGNFSLENEQIEIKIENLSIGSAESQKIFSRYLIKVDYYKLQNISDEALIGLISHELSHLEFYSDKNFIYMIFYGFHYQFFPTFRKNVERETDINAIERGYGEELLAFKEYRLSTANEEDKKFFEENYLSINETKELANLS